MKQGKNLSGNPASQHKIVVLELTKQQQQKKIFERKNCPSHRYVQHPNFIWLNRARKPTH